MDENGFTLRQASEILGISMSTLRRKVKNNEIEAYLVDSPYGQQYIIPAREIDQAQMITDVVRVDRPVPIEKLAEAIQTALVARDKDLIDNLLEIQEWTRESSSKLDKQTEEIVLLREEARESSNKIDIQTNEIHFIREELSTREKSQAEEIQLLRQEISELRDAIKQSQTKRSWLGNLFKRGD